MRHINGSHLEGGGQVLRNALGCAALMVEPISVSQIRGGRPKPGLKAQHLHGLRLVARLAGAELTGDELNSQEISFAPQQAPLGGVYTVELPTAGALSLIVQAALPVSLFASGPVELRLVGGTNVPFSPHIDYLERVVLRHLPKFGVPADSVSYALTRRGFMPKGGGEIKLAIKPVDVLSAVDLCEFGKLDRIRGYAFVCGRTPPVVAQKLAATAERLLREALPGTDIEVAATTEKVPGDGAAMVLVAETTTGCILGADTGCGPRDRAEKQAKGAVERLLGNIRQQVCVDTNMQDQMIVFMALAAGTSRFLTGEISLHTQTAIHFVSMLTKAKFEVSPGDVAGTNIVQCEGIGYRAGTK